VIEYQTNEFGLRVEDMNYFMSIFESINEIESVIMYGSRARGDYQLGSDIDLSLRGKSVTIEHVAHIKYLIENESQMLLIADVNIFNKISNKQLIELIKRDGIEIYKKRNKSILTPS